MAFYTLCEYDGFWIESTKQLSCSLPYEEILLFWKQTDLSETITYAFYNYNAKHGSLVYITVIQYIIAINPMFSKKK